MLSAVDAPTLSAVIYQEWLHRQNGMGWPIALVKDPETVLHQYNGPYQYCLRFITSTRHETHLENKCSNIDVFEDQLTIFFNV